MYNESQKMEFLNYVDMNKYYIDLFRATENIENELEKDLSLFSTGEIIDFVIGLRYSWSLTNVIRTNIIKYCEWCVIRGYCKYNPFSAKFITKRNLEKIYLEVNDGNLYYVSPEEYKQDLSILKNTKYGDYIAGVFAAVYNGLSGSKYSNLYRMRLSDIDNDNNTISLYDGRLVPINDETIKMLVKASKVYDVYSIRRIQYTESYYLDSIWKLSSEPTDQKYYRKFTTMMEFARQTLMNDDLTKNSLEHSGYFNFMVGILRDRGYDILEIEHKYHKNISGMNHEFKDIFDEFPIEMTMTKFVTLYRSFIEELRTKE